MKSTLQEALVTLIPVVASLIIAGIGTLISLLGQAKLKARMKTLEKYFEDDKINDYYCICPKCGSKVMVSRLKIYTQLKEQTDRDAETEPSKEDK